MAPAERRRGGAPLVAPPLEQIALAREAFAGDFAMTHSQWLITGVDRNGKKIEVHHHGMEVHRRLSDGTWVFFIDHPFGADSSWAVDRPPYTE